MYLIFVVDHATFTLRNLLIWHYRAQPAPTRRNFQFLIFNILRTKCRSSFISAAFSTINLVKSNEPAYLYLILPGL